MDAELITLREFLEKYCDPRKVLTEENINTLNIVKDIVDSKLEGIVQREELDRKYLSTIMSLKGKVVKVPVKQLKPKEKPKEKSNTTAYNMCPHCDKLVEKRGYHKHEPSCEKKMAEKKEIQDRAAAARPAHLSPEKLERLRNEKKYRDSGKHGRDDLDILEGS